MLPVALSIKSDKADRLARDLAELTGESLTEAIVGALEVRLDLERRTRRNRGVSDIVERYRALPVLDTRHPDDIVGYDEHGLPT